MNHLIFASKDRLALAVLAGWFVGALWAFAEDPPPITGVTDRQVYRDSVTFKIDELQGFVSVAELNGRPVPVGDSLTVSIPDFYELRVTRQNTASGQGQHELLRFIVYSSERGGSEWGLPPWTPHPSVPSTAEELADSRLRLLMPAAYPNDSEVPIAAWLESTEGTAVRANGLLDVSGAPSIPIRRGVGSGFLPAGQPLGMLSVQTQLPGIQMTRNVLIETNTPWTGVAGVIEGTTSWGPSARLQITADLTIPAGSTLTIGPGTIVRLDPGVVIVLDGRLVIEGTPDQPVVFAPGQRSRPWGGIQLRKDTSELVATAAIFTGSGANSQWFSQNGYGSHRGEECLFFCERSPRVSLTDCAAFDLAGQFGHAVNGGAFEFTRLLVQRCTTGGEYTGSTWNVNDSAFIECPVDSPVFVDGDNDGIYLVSGTWAFTNTLFGWVKDDAIDCGGSGIGTLTLDRCWFESTFHEAMALSGAKTVRTSDSVFIDCGQGLEVGYSGPLATADHCLALGNLTGMRFGDSYAMAYTGFLTVTNSLLLHNYRDVFGHTWNTSGTSFDTNQWVERILQMDVQSNYLTAPNPYHSRNRTWQGLADGGRLTPFLTTPPGAQPGVGIATWAPQMQTSDAANGIPVRLSSFSTNRVSVDCVLERPGGNVVVHRAEFLPGETLKPVPLSAGPAGDFGVLRVRLTNAEGCQVTGVASVLLLDAPGPGSTLGWARFDDELVLYWTDASLALEMSEDVSGPWSRLVSQRKPTVLPLGSRQQFYRLVLADGL